MVIRTEIGFIKHNTKIKNIETKKANMLIFMNNQYMHLKMYNIWAYLKVMQKINQWIN